MIHERNNDVTYIFRHLDNIATAAAIASSSVKASSILISSNPRFLPEKSESSRTDYVGSVERFSPRCSARFTADRFAESTRSNPRDRRSSASVVGAYVSQVRLDER